MRLLGDFADLSTARLLEWIYGRRVPPEFRRFLPLILIAVFAFLLVPNLLHRSHKSGLSDSERATRTIEAMKLIEAGEQRYKAVHGRFTQHLADLLPANSRLASDLAVGLDVRLDVSTNGQASSRRWRAPFSALCAPTRARRSARRAASCSKAARA